MPTLQDVLIVSYLTCPNIQFWHKLFIKQSTAIEFKFRTLQWWHYYLCCTCQLYQSHYYIYDLCCNCQFYESQYNWSCKSNSLFKIKEKQCLDIFVILWIQLWSSHKPFLPALPQLLSFLPVNYQYLHYFCSCVTTIDKNFNNALRQLTCLHVFLILFTIFGDPKWSRSFSQLPSC